MVMQFSWLIKERRQSGQLLFLMSLQLVLSRLPLLNGRLDRCLLSQLASVPNPVGAFDPAGLSAAGTFESTLKLFHEDAPQECESPAGLG